ncbi:nitric oxide reductase activation protein NorD [Marinibacterium sp. SX1]|uniref:nitric oxide reductase activation protein NorD n=1 Tax=Marinibacterium sp. SX1 TaxID=3388424 RepID=UPI003D182CD4
MTGPQDNGTLTVGEGAQPAMRDVVAMAVAPLRPHLSRTELDQLHDLATAIAPLGNVALSDFAAACLTCTRRFGGKATLSFGQTCLHVEELADGDAVRHLLRHAGAAMLYLRSHDALAAYVEALVTVARQMPWALRPLVEAQTDLLAGLDADGFRRWIGAGLALAGWDRDPVRSYFRLRSEEARRLLAQLSGDLNFASVAPDQRAFLQAMWSLRPVIVPFEFDAAHPNLQRSSFSGPVLRIPARYPGVRGNRARDRFRAALSHICAHLVHGPEPQDTGRLKPLQIALVSLFEDARVEALAGLDHPGLARLWAGMHDATPGQTRTVDKLLARLARALADPAYQDPDPWVGKGRRLFNDARTSWEQPELSRELGSLLGNDLGQMRIPFNARGYLVAPAYRDDNSGLWQNLPDSDDPDRTEDTVELNGDTAGRATTAVPLRETPDQPDRVSLGTVPEWDFRSGIFRRDWVQVYEYAPDPAPVAAVRRIAAAAEIHVPRIERLIRSSRVGQTQRQRRQLQGDTIDIDAGIGFLCDRRAGLTPDPRIYQSRRVPDRALSVFVLLDMSQSTRGAAGTGVESILSVERKAAAALGMAMDRLGDPFAMAGFCSDGRKDVRIYPVKGFAGGFDPAAMARLAGLRGGLSTRLGAAMRACGQTLAARRTERKLLLVITDGAPSDRDVPDDRYLAEDARLAVAGLRQRGIDVFAVGLGRDGLDQFPRIFSRRNYELIADLDALTPRLTRIYHRLAQ